MDYSLYIKTETCPDKSEMRASWKRIGLKRNKFNSIDHKEIYHIGIIDYL